MQRNSAGEEKPKVSKDEQELEELRKIRDRTKLRLKQVKDELKEVKQMTHIGSSAIGDDVKAAGQRELQARVCMVI